MIDTHFTNGQSILAIHTHTMSLAINDMPTTCNASCELWEHQHVFCLKVDADFYLCMEGMRLNLIASEHEP